MWLTERKVGVASAPSPLPSPSDLAALDPAVSITLLVAAVLLALLVYIGPAIRDRIRPPQPEPTPEPAPAPPPAGSAGAVDRTEQFLQHLLRQIDEAAAREDDLEAQVRARDARIAQLEREVLRLESLLWQRGQR